MQESIVPSKQILPKGRNWQLYLLFILSILWIITLAVLIYLFVENSRLKKEQLAVYTPTPSDEIADVLDPDSTPYPDSIIVSQDATWNLYTNYKLGFSLKIPKAYFHSYGACDWKEAEKSYRPNMGSVPVKIFEEDDHAYISSEYFYELAGERVENNVHYYAACNKVANTLAKLGDREIYSQQSWKLSTATVTSDAQLESFVQKHYGEGCKVAQKKPTGQDDVVDVQIDSITITPNPGGEPIGLENLSCPVNYSLYIKYSPSRSRATTWVIGQSYTFFKDAKYNQYDDDMAKSFRMLD